LELNTHSVRHMYIFK